MQLADPLIENVTQCDQWTCVLTVKLEYIIPSADVLNKNIYPSPVSHIYTHDDDDIGKLWLTLWHAQSDSIKFGRLTATPSLVLTQFRYH